MGFSGEAGESEEAGLCVEKSRLGGPHLLLTGSGCLGLVVLNQDRVFSWG